jgi:ATP-dependent DNA ligase
MRLTPPLEPMEAQPLHALPDGDEWQFEPKWDGFRCLLFKHGDEIYLQSKSKPLARYFPEVVESAKQLPVDDVVLDGELVIPVDGQLSFDTLLLRLHPAESRVRKLAAEFGARFLVFDLLGYGNESLLDDPLIVRRERLERLFADHGADMPPLFALSPCTYSAEEATAWFTGHGAGMDGVMAKLIGAPYTAGERTGMCKVKHERTADCVVGGYRLGAGGTLVGSLLLGLFGDDGLLHHVGFTSSFAAQDKVALTAHLEALRGPPGFTGRAPGGPSRWNNGKEKPWYPLRHELVVEVQFDHASADRFRHGTTIRRWRPDKPPTQCRLEQIAPAGMCALSLLR